MGEEVGFWPPCSIAVASKSRRRGRQGSRDLRGPDISKIIIMDTNENNFHLHSTSENQYRRVSLFFVFKLNQHAIERCSDDDASLI